MFHKRTCRSFLQGGLHYVIDNIVYRLSGISLLLGSLLVALGVIPIFFIGDSPTSTMAAPAALLRVLGGMSTVLGLPGMYVRQAERAGFLGLIGFLLTVLYILILGVAGDTINALVCHSFYRQPRHC